MRRIHPLSKHPYPVSDIKLSNGTLIVSCHDETSANRFCSKLKQTFIVADLENLDLPKFNYTQSKDNKKTINISGEGKLNIAAVLDLLEKVKLIAPQDKATFSNNLSINNQTVLTTKSSNH